MHNARVPEAVLSRIWNEGWHSRELRTVDGLRVGVVYRGVWTHSNGPDFRDAMVDIDGRLVQGSIELHIDESDWQRHGHHLDTAYDSVVLHVVLEADAAHRVRGPGGVVIPTVQLAPFLHGSIQTFMSTAMPVVLGDIGQRACLPTLAGQRPAEIHRVLRREGWKRLAEKQLRYEQEMLIRTPGETLYRAVLDALGLSGNRAGMEAVADRLPLVLLERIVRDCGTDGALAVLTGCGGFLPLSPGHLSLVSDSQQNPATIESLWESFVDEYGLSSVSTSVWNLNRVRPLNHPVRRLASLASLLTLVSAEGLFASILAFAQEGASGWNFWLAQAEPSIGESRRQQIIVNALAPFVAAFASVVDDQPLLEESRVIWETLPGGVDDDIARKTRRQIAGENRFPVRSALEVQGLHQIGRNGCAELRCFECPVAALAVRYEPQQLID